MTNLKSNGVFITATDTGVGKTYVAALIAEELKKRFRVGVFKPAVTGSLSDVYKLKRSSGSPLSSDEINPVFFKTPLAPYVASKLARPRREIDVGAITRSYRKVCKSSEFLIVEGAGGLYVPVTKNLFVIDLIKKFRLPVILVVRPKLGTINHTLLSLKALKKRKIVVKAVVMNNHTGRDAAERTNPGVLRELIDVPLFIVKKNARGIPSGLIELLVSY